MLINQTSIPQLQSLLLYSNYDFSVILRRVQFRVTMTWHTPKKGSLPTSIFLVVSAVLLLLALDDLPLVDDVEEVEEVEDSGGDAHDAERARRLEVTPRQRRVVRVRVVPREARHA